MKKQVVKYPCRWSYRIIGRDEETMRVAVKQCIKEANYTLTASNTSRSGKYVSLNLETVVLNEEGRNRIYSDLKNMPCVQMVL